MLELELVKVQASFIHIFRDKVNSGSGDIHEADMCKLAIYISNMFIIAIYDGYLYMAVKHL